MPGCEPGIVNKRALKVGPSYASAGGSRIIGRMLLVIDVGNTQTHIGAFARNELVEHWRFATAGEDTADELAVRLTSLLGLRGIHLGSVDASIVCSVVPRLIPEY